MSIMMILSLQWWWRVCMFLILILQSNYHCRYFSKSSGGYSSVLSNKSGLYCSGGRIKSYCILFEDIYYSLESLAHLNWTTSSIYSWKLEIGGTEQPIKDIWFIYKTPHLATDHSSLNYNSELFTSQSSDYIKCNIFT